MKNPYDKQPPREEIERSIMGWLQDDEVGSTIKITTTQVQLLAHHIYYDVFHQSQPSISAEAAFKQWWFEDGRLLCGEKNKDQAKDLFNVGYKAASSQGKKVLKDWDVVAVGNSLREIIDIEPYQGEVVEMGEMDYDEKLIHDIIDFYACKCGCGTIERSDNFCPNCAAKIVWK